MSPETLTTLEPVIIALCWIIGVVDVIGLTTVFLERFGGAKSRIVSTIGDLMPGTAMGRSMKQLRTWHAIKDAVRKNERPPVDVKVEEQDVLQRHPFSLWMVNEMVRKYENNVQGIAYLGAAVLIFVIGLRGIQFLTKEHSAYIILALMLEFSLIGILGFIIFYKPEEKKEGGIDIEARMDIKNLTDELVEVKKVLVALVANNEKVAGQLGLSAEELRRTGSDALSKGSPLRKP